MNDTDMKNSRIIKFLHQIVPCLLTIILTGLYTLKGWHVFNIRTVNVLCLPLFMWKLALGFVEKNNKKKSLLFLSAVFISILVGGLNLWDDYQAIGALRLSGLSVWSLIWGILLLIASASSVVVLNRILRWSQEQWEAVQKLNQDNRIRKKESRLKYISAKNEQRLSEQQKQHRYRLQYREHWQEKRSEKQKIKLRNQNERLEFKSKKRQCRRERKLNTPTNNFIHLKDVIRGISVCLIIAGFFVLPLIGGNQNNNKFAWIEGVENIVNAVRDDSEDTENLGGSEYLDVVDEPETSGDAGNSEETNGFLINAFFNYLMIYCAATVIAIILAKIVVNSFRPSSDGQEWDSIILFKHYKSSIAILIVAGVFLYVLTDGQFVLDKVDEAIVSLIFIIILILLLLVSVEVMQITLDQCLEKKSFLKKIMKLIFLVIIRYFMELLMGVVENLRIQSAISSLFDLIFPEQDEGSFGKRINDKLNQLFDEAIGSVEASKTKTSVPRRRSRRNIWRRRKR